MKQPIAVGDKVQYSAEWLRSTGQYTGDICFAKGIVREVYSVGKGSMILALVDWNVCNIPVKVNVANLERVR